MFVRTQAIVTSSRFKQVRIKQLIIALAISAFASLCTAANTHAAGTADVKADFGAIGDGIADDTAAIRNAFNSDNDTIIVPEGEYRLTGQIKFAKGDKTIIGEKATLFADDNYTRPTAQYADYWLVVIRNFSNITFKGVHFDARKGSSESTKFPGLVGIINANGIHFDSCTFTSDPGLTNASITAIDFYSHWSDVSVTNSTISMLHHLDKDDGGGIMFRCWWEFPCSNAVFTNNTMHKTSGIDEILWLAVDTSDARTILSNIEISGNRFYQESTGVYGLSTHAKLPDQIKNVNFHNNELIGNRSGDAIMFDGVENFNLYDNDIYTKSTSPGITVNGELVPTGGVFGSRDEDSDAPITTDTVKVYDNRTITLDSEFRIDSLATGNQPYHIFNNHHITINAPRTAYLVEHYGNFINNNVTVNGNVGGVITTYPYRNDQSQPKIVQDNHIQINGVASHFLRNYNANLAAPATYTGNTIISTRKNTNPNQDDASASRLTMMHDFAMNGHPITISNNTFINGSAVENDTSLELLTIPNTGSNTVTARNTNTHLNLLWTVIGLEDTTPADQTVNICNNTIKGFGKMANSWLSPTFNLTCN